MPTDAMDVLGGLVLEDGRLWAEAAVDVQVRDAQAWLFDSRPYHYCTRARGYSKTADAAAVVVAWLLTGRPGSRFYWLAADVDQGRLALDSIEGYVQRTEALQGRLEVQASRVIATETGSSLTVLPADAAGTFGLRPDGLILDELAQWAETPTTERVFEAATTAMTKMPGARMLVITTAGNPRHFARKLLEAALESPLWRVSETPDPAPWQPEDRLAEQRARLPEAIYAQLYLNQWTEAAGDFLDPTVVDAAFTLESPALRRVDGRTYVAALDLGAVNDRTVFAIGHREPNDKKIHLDLMKTWQGSRKTPVQFDEVGEYVANQAGAFRFSLSVDPWQAKELVSRLQKRGVRVREFHFSPQSKMRLASTLLHALNTAAVALYPADGLRDELVDLRVKQAGTGMFAFDHAPGKHDDRAVTLALMLVEAIDRAPKPAGSHASRDDPYAPEPTISRGGLHLQGKKYLDLAPGGQRVPPPGWENVNERSAG